ncbi:MAG TPA: hypothetical protein VIK25_07980 [Gemmatimonadaceae bacterium]
MVVRASVKGGAHPRTMAMRQARRESDVQEPADSSTSIVRTVVCGIGGPVLEG